MLIIVDCSKDEIDIYGLTYNHVHHMLKNKPKQMLKNNFELVYVKTKKDICQIANSNCHLEVGIKSNFTFALKIFFKIIKKRLSGTLCWLWVEYEPK